MDINTVYHGTSRTDGIEAKIQKQFSNFEKYASDLTVDVTLSVKNNGTRHKVEVTIPVGKKVIHAEENDKDLYAAIDKIEEKVSRMLRKNKEKTIESHRNHDVKREYNTEQIPEEFTPRIVKNKRFKLEPMSEKEACEAIEMLGHSFYLFLNEKTEKTNLLYLREDGNYGLIEIE